MDTEQRSEQDIQRSGEFGRPIVLSNEAIPADVAAQIESHCRHYALVGKARAAVEEQVKLSLYFGGRSVIATPTENGLFIHAADLDDPVKIRALRTRLRAQGLHVLSLYPSPWETDQITSAFSSK